MKKSIRVLISASVLIGLGAAGSYYYYSSQASTNKRHGVGVQKLDCDDSVIFSLRLQQNGKVIWQKTHEELFSSPPAIPSTDNRFREKNIVPIIELLAGYENIRSIRVTPCDGKPVTLDYPDIQASKDFYYLGQNRKDRMKLLKQINPYDHITIMRNVIDIDMIQ